MRLLVRFALVFSVVALTSSITSRAQFTPPADEELKMSADPKAPGAGAVYLYREQITDDMSHFVSFYARIKVLTQKGMDLATVTLPYQHGVDRVTEIDGRTIHSDGSIVPLTAKPDDLMDFKVKRLQVNTVVFSLPDVQVGSILEYRLKIRTPGNRVSEPFWDLQIDQFVHKEHFEFRALTDREVQVVDSTGQGLTNIMWTDHLPPGAKVNYDAVKNAYSLDLSDLPAIPNEDWMGPTNALRWSVRFYYTNSGNANYFWQTTAKKWNSTVDEFTKPTPGLTKIANDLLAPTDSDSEKARKLYAAVQKLDNTRFSRSKSETERKNEKIKEIRIAEDLWRQQSGTDDQLTLLYIALCRAVGLKVFPARVVDRGRALFDMNYLSTKQLDDTLAIAVIDGQEVFLDPGQKMCPFGSLNWRHQLAGGFRMTDGGPELFTTPSATFKTAKMQRIADLIVDASGSVSGTVRVVMTGPEALRWRQLSLENDPGEVQKQFNDSIKKLLPEGVTAEFDHFVGIEDYTGSLIGNLKVSGNLGAVTGKHILLPGLFFESRARNPFVAQDKRETPIDMHFPRVEEDDVTYHLPSGYTLETPPTNASAGWAGHALMSTTFKTTGASVNALRSFIYIFTVLDPSEYSLLHDFFLKVATADQTQLVLTRDSAAKQD
ncbi:MAG: DUF3857 domain-containing protein [Terracidiphilus sp.]